jgi:hypothetical protein
LVDSKRKGKLSATPRDVKRPIAIDVSRPILSGKNMPDNSQRDFVRRSVRTMQIIVGALAGGVLLFLVIVVFLATANVRHQMGQPIITYAAIGMAVAVIVGWLIVPAVIAAQMKKSVIEKSSGQPDPRAPVANADLGDVPPLVAIFQTRTIIAAALLEGAAFFACIAYMLERQPIALAAVGVLLLLILSQMPTVGRVESWLETELSIVSQLRQLR